MTDETRQRTWSIAELVAYLQREGMVAAAERVAILESEIADLAAALHESEDKRERLAAECDGQRIRAEQAEDSADSLREVVAGLDSYAGVLGLLSAILDDRYPADVFKGSSGDDGVALVAETRRLLGELRAVASLRADLRAAAKALKAIREALVPHGDIVNCTTCSALMADAHVPGCPTADALAALARPSVAKAAEASDAE